MKWLAIIVAGLIPAVALGAGEVKSDPIRVGAYYFHGWSGKTDPWHVPDKLKTEFPERKPVWGWYTNTVEPMERQIDYAADNGLDFFSFCWYHSPTQPQWVIESLNQGLQLYLQSQNRSRLRFCLFVSNHDDSFSIGPDEWQACTDEWIRLFRQGGYLTIDHRPVIIFNRHDLLLKEWTEPASLAAAFEQFGQKARAAGLEKPYIGTHALPSHDLEKLKACGFDFFTGYNYGNAWSAEGKQRNQPYSQLRKAHRRIWNGFAEKAVLPYIPTVTTGWDMRPWEAGPPSAFYYTPRTPENIAAFVGEALQWARQHPTATPDQPLVLLYAWNENGEGGYLTPTDAEGDRTLKAIKQVIDKQPAP